MHKGALNVYLYKLAYNFFFCLSKLLVKKKLFVNFGSNVNFVVR